MAGARFLTVGIGIYRQTREGGYINPCGNGLEIDTSVCTDA